MPARIGRTFSVRGAERRAFRAERPPERRERVEDICILAFII